jgi:hypothetical protein
VAVVGDHDFVVDYFVLDFRDEGEEEQGDSGHL